MTKAGHPVTAVDQRGHGLSEKPVDGYDFATVTADLRQLVKTLNYLKPVLVGQSWGGNVVLEFGARYSGTTSHLIFVDGGFLELHQRGSWEQVSTELRPPNLTGTPYTTLKALIVDAHPDWSEEGIEATLNNFETRPDGTVCAWLSLDRHMSILRAMYEQKPQSLYPQVQEPVLICVADDGSEWAQRKQEPVNRAAIHIPKASIRWFPDTDHDIHGHRPQALADAILNFVSH